MSLTEETLFEKDDKIIQSITAKTFNFKRRLGTKSVLNNYTVKETDKTIILAGSTDFVNVFIFLSIYLSFSAETVKLESELLIVILRMSKPTTINPSPVFQVGFLIHSCFYFCFWVVWSLWYWATISSHDQGSLDQESTSRFKSLLKRWIIWKSIE